MAYHFRTALHLSNDVAISVEFISDEELTRVTVDSTVYECQAGSDDDDFCFVAEGRPALHFDFC